MKRWMVILEQRFGSAAVAARYVEKRGEFAGEGN